jgi:threonylcarbamoyladenosine tRNA methylthiotransferase MtaB
VDDELMGAVIEGKNTCHSMHVVLQSGSNVILKRMNRKYTRQIFLDTVERLKSASPDFTFTTDVIVGFPGESEADFAETLEVMQAVKFAKVHMFPYSDRPRTRANLMPNKVPCEIAKRRKNEVLTLAEKTAFELRERYVGRKMSILTEENTAGHTMNFLRVRIDEGLPNELVEVELMANTPEGLIGKR